MILSDATTVKRYRDLGVWGDATLDALFKRTAQRHPDRCAAVDPLNRERITANPPRELSYGALDRAADRMAALFLEAGLNADDVVAVQLPNVAEQLVVILAAWRAGLIVTPLPLMWRRHELEAALPLVAPRAIITMPMRDFDFPDMMRKIAFDQMTVRFVMGFGADLPDGVMGLDSVFDDTNATAQNGADPFLRGPGADDVATVTWGAGNCASPCPIPRSHNQWLAAGLLPFLEVGLDDGATILSPYPLAGLVPLGCFLVPWLLTGGTLVLHHPFDLELFKEQCVSHGVDFTGLPPSVIDVMKSEGIFPAEPQGPGIKKLACIWPAPVIPENRSLQLDQLRVDLVDVCSVNEMVLVASVRKANTKPGLIPHGAWHAPYGSDHGPMLLDSRVKGSSSVNNSAGSLLGGELLIQSPMMFDRYFPTGQSETVLPELARDPSGFVNTGQKCALVGGKDPMIELTARDNNTIVHGGVWISAPELDRLYADHGDLADAAVFTFPDPVMGERIMAAVVPSPGVDVSLSDFVAYLRDLDVAPYKLPDRLIRVKTIPRDGNGNVLRDQVLQEI